MPYLTNRIFIYFRMPDIYEVRNEQVGRLTDFLCQQD